MLVVHLVSVTFGFVGGGAVALEDVLPLLLLITILTLCNQCYFEKIGLEFITILCVENGN